jgi:hypothetical protein
LHHVSGALGDMPASGRRWRLFEIGIRIAEKGPASTWRVMLPAESSHHFLLSSYPFALFGSPKPHEAGEIR